MNLLVLLATLYLALSWFSSMLDEDGHLTMRGFWTGLIFTPISWWLLAWAFKTTGLF